MDSLSETPGFKVGCLDYLKAAAGEPQYEADLVATAAAGLDRLGAMVAWGFHSDPKRVAFTLARYKFCAKMLAGRERVLEVGCGDGWASRVVRQAVRELVGIDFDPALLASARERADPAWPIEFVEHDILKAPVLPRRGFEAAYSLDVLEHITPGRSHLFVRNICESLDRDGVFICGAPSLESQAYASAHSKAGHCNCMRQEHLGHLMRQHFANVFLFSMSDEVVHTGFGPMSHYNLALCVGPKA